MKYKNIFERYVLQINDLLCPGQVDNKVVVFTKDEQYNSSNEEKIETWINKELFPWGFMSAILCYKMHHGSFVSERCYIKPEDVIEMTADDYDLDVEKLNFIFAVMSAAELQAKKKLEGIIMIGYWPEAGTATVQHFDTEEEFSKSVEWELQELECDKEEEE